MLLSIRHSDFFQGLAWWGIQDDSALLSFPFQGFAKFYHSPWHAFDILQGLKLVNSR
jgi:hypothetical protein